MTITFPKFVSSDNELNITYNYRCEVYQRHVKQTPAGYVITEFLPDVPWAGIYNTISCAASHHFRDGRWMKDPSVLEEYANFWCTEGNPRLYSFPIADSILALSNVTGDYGTAEKLYPKLAEIHQAWDDQRADETMYRQECGRDGMEFSISGDGIRPTINSYMYADKCALGRIAERLGDAEQAQKYRKDAEILASQINERLWNNETGMFGVISDRGEVQNVREQIGYVPWIYGIPDAGKDACFRNLLDTSCFLAPYGLRTADAAHPDYMKPFNHECLWNGPVWPFATAQTLTAVIEYLHTAEHPTISPAEFMSLLLTYAYSHRDTDGTPCLDENMDPDTGIWLAREIMRKWNRPGKDPTRGQHYNHSSFIDLVMTGICGIRPSEGNRLTIHPLGTSLDTFAVSDVQYHDHTLAVAWDRTSGLCVTVDGTREYFREAAEDITLEIEL
ncbi:MAG: hypothetical protein IKU40_02005 [Clostridia bacterium]|nr:hypothetical protein [Clostridia bacterium]